MPPAGSAGDFLLEDIFQLPGPQDPVVTEIVQFNHSGLRNGLVGQSRLPIHGPAMRRDCAYPPSCTSAYQSPGMADVPGLIAPVLSVRNPVTYDFVDWI